MTDNSGSSAVVDSGRGRAEGGRFGRLTLATLLISSLASVATLAIGPGSAVAAPSTPVTLLPALYGPEGIAFDQAGDLFITNDGSASVSVLPKSSGTIFGTAVVANTLTPIVTEIGNPVAVAFDGAGDLFIGSEQGSVSVLPVANGTIFGTAVTANKVKSVASGLSEPGGLAFDGAGDLFISDQSSGNVSVLPVATGTIFGTPVIANTVTALGAATGLHNPMGLAFDGLGDLFIANETNGTVSVLPATSGTIFNVPLTPNTLATVVTGMASPFTVAFDAAGDLFVQGRNGGNVSVMPKATGSIFGTSVTANTLASVASGLTTPTGLAFDGTGDLFISDGTPGTISALPLASGSLFGVPVTLNTVTTVASALSDPQGVATDAAGDIFTADADAGTVSVLPVASGSLFGVPVIANRPATVESGLNFPVSLAFDAAGDLFIGVENSNSVEVLPRATGTIFGVPVTANTLKTVASGFDLPLGLAFDGAGNLYVSNESGAETVEVLPAATGTLFGVPVTANTLATVVSSGLSSPEGLAADNAGNLFIANSGSGKISVLPAATGTLFGVPVTANTLTTVTSGPIGTNGLAFDGAGDLFASTNGGTILVIPKASGSLFGQAVTANTEAAVATGLYSPEGVAIDGAGILYITDSVSGLLELPTQDVITPTASQPTLAATEGSPLTGQVAAFMDTNTGQGPGAFAASINWGDGSTTPGVVSEVGRTFDVSTSPAGHSYDVGGPFTITVTLSVVAPGTATGSVGRSISVVTTNGKGYWMVASDGGIFTEGDAGFYGSQGATPLNKPIVGMAATPDGKGYWMVASDGGIFTEGDAGFYGSQGGTPLNQPIVGMAATPDGKGYWMVASDGGIFTEGDAGFYGSQGGTPLNQPIVGMAATPDGQGYWLVAADGGIFSFGDAQFYGSTGSIHLNKPIVGMAATPDGKGYWFVAADGGIFSFGDALFYGSTGSIHLNQPIVGMAATPDGQGYWFVASDGGIFTEGDAGFYGSTGSIHLNKPIVGMASS